MDRFAPMRFPNIKNWYRQRPLLGLRPLVTGQPPSIVDSRHKLVLLWSAKAGSTFAIKWLFNHMGLLDEALAYHDWIHTFRTERLYPSAEYKASVKDFCKSPSSYHMIKVVRNPFKRAVSSYVHAAVAGYEDTRISVFLRRPINAESRFSFREFVAYLGSIDMTACNIHHRVQTHPLERYVIPKSWILVDLDNSMNCFPRVESFLGLPQTDRRLYRESRHHTRKSLADETCADRRFDIFHKPSRKRPLPDYPWFYDTELEDMIYGLYAEDFLRYGFSTTLASFDRI